VSSASEIAVFLVSFALTLEASVVLAGAVDKIGQRFRLSDAAVGILTALAADSPEISAAVAAFTRHQHTVGVGVVLGSNVFNIAALLGLPAVISGRVRVGRHALVLVGGVTLAITGLAAALVLGAASPVPITVLVLLVASGYVLVSARAPSQLLGWPGGSWLSRAVSEEDIAARKPERPRHATRDDAFALLPALVTVVGGSVFMVRSSTTLGQRWGVSAAVVGGLVLAGLTGMPNVVAGVRLALLHRGPAVVSSGLNSNSINVVAGLCLPALAVGVTAGAQGALFAGWLVGLTVLAIALALRRGQLGRADGLLLLAGYAGFAAVVAAGPVR
jgi:cation:H+ antiporter